MSDPKQQTVENLRKEIQFLNKRLTNMFLDKEIMEQALLKIIAKLGGGNSVDIAYEAIAEVSRRNDLVNPGNVHGQSRPKINNRSSE